MNINAKPENELFSSYDLSVAAALCAAGFTLLGIKRNRGNRVLFLFEHSEQLVADASAHWNGQLQVNSLDFFNALKNLKNQLYSNQYDS